MWIGNACLTGSARRLVVTYGPRTFTNDADLFDRGGFTAVVDLRSGAVTKLPVRSSLAYFSPGCGTGEKAVVSQFGGERVDDPTVRELSSRLITIDAAKGTVAKPVLLNTELSSPVPVGDGVVAAGSGRLVRVGANGALTGLAATSGVAFKLAVDGKGAVVYLNRSGERVRVKRTLPRAGAEAATLAEGQLSDVGLTRGAGGRVFLTGAPSSVTAMPATVERVRVPAASAMSSTGAVALTRVGWAHQTDPRVPVTEPGAPRPVEITATSVARGAALAFTVEPGVTGPRALAGRAPHPALGSPAGARPGRSGPSARAAGSPNDPIEREDERYCSVPRNDPRNQAMQPKPRQVEWAVDQAIYGQLTVLREANWKNLGMQEFTPQGLFPPVALTGGGRVPAQIMLAILAQESNVWQAPGFVLPGATGNPLIGNFYGRDVYNDNSADDWDIRWDKADCGYGVAQVTDGMRLAGKEKDENDTAYEFQTQRAVALDFATNVAAGLRILQTKWNEVRDAGIMLNNGNPAKLENWFFAVWAYNSGFHPDLGNGQPWGVGWGNNPINPRYDQQRQPFMEFSYDDARTPQRWPYAEKIMGWAGHPVEINESPTKMVHAYNFAGWPTVAARIAVKPPMDLFCDDSNDCDPNASVQPNDPDVANEPPGPCLHRNASGLYDLRCWYHQSTQWKGNCDSCGTESVRFDPGFAYQEDGASYPPSCGRVLPDNALIIDDLPSWMPSVRPNCARTSNAGTFGFEFPADASGLYPAKIDLHQIGGGYGGHFYFGHTRTTAAHGGKMRIGATWRLDAAVSGWHRLRVAIPDHRAWTMQADYVINLGDGRLRHRVINQVYKQNTWVDLGVFNLNGRASITLTTASLDGTGDDSIAWDAVAFVPTSAPTVQYVAMGDSYAAGEGVEPYDVNSDHLRENDRKNACHRSHNAYPRQLTRPGSSITIAREAAEGRASFGFIACSGALTTSVASSAVNAPPSSSDAAGHTDWGRANYRFGELTQVDTGWLDQETSLVTISIGGNDARFTDVLRGCILVNPAEGCYAPGHRLTRESGVVDPDELKKFETAVILNMLPDKLMATYRAINSRAPNAKIVVVGYPQLFPDRPWQTCQTVNPTTQRFLNNFASMLTISIAKAVNQVRNEGVNITLADPTPAWRRGVGDSSHWACPTGASGSWTNLIINRSETGSGANVPGVGSFHPKEAGQFALATIAGLGMRTPTAQAAIADRIEDGAVALGHTVNEAQAHAAAGRCLDLTRIGGVVGDPCMDMPIFFPSVTNAGNAAVNDDEAIRDNPPWVLLTYASSAEMTKVVPNRSWFDRAAIVQSKCPNPRNPGMHCDEYPYYSSDFAAAWDEFIGETSPVSTHLKEVPEGENTAEGSRLGQFYTRCAVETTTYDESTRQPTGMGNHYLTVPLVQADGSPTFYIC
jgi:hypothetical protein